MYVLAQDPDPTIQPCPDPKLPDCPIDSNLIILVIGAFVIAAKKAFDYNKNTLSI